MITLFPCSVFRIKLDLMISHEGLHLHLAFSKSAVLERGIGEGISYLKTNYSLTTQTKLQVPNHQYLFTDSSGAGYDGVFMNAGADSCI